MFDGHLHRATSPDGTRVAGRVRGHGPPLVLVHGSLEDGETCWRAMLPHLSDHYTCYLPSTRGRGESGAAGSVAPERRVEDVVAFVDSIGEPVAVFGESDGGALALAAAAATDTVSAVAAYEPTVFEVAGEDLAATLEETLPRIGAAVAAGRTAEAARTFAAVVANDDEMAELATSGYLHEAARYMPLTLRELEAASHPEAPSPTDPGTLATIGVPVVVLRGTQSAWHRWFADGARHVRQHAADVRESEVEAAGHFGVNFQPQAVAAKVAGFFAGATRV